MACLALALLAGCGEQGSEERVVPVRIDLGDVSAKSMQSAAPTIPATSAPSVWTRSQSARAAWYGPPDAPAQLAVSCEGWEKRAARLVIVRYAPADKGAEALFAIQGSKGILRLPVSAVRIGKQGYAWRGILDAGDPRAEVLLGSGLKATVPGGGELHLPQMGGAGAVVSECVSTAAPAKEVQTLPNRASNPETSPADR